MMKMIANKQFEVFGEYMRNVSYKTELEIMEMINKYLDGKISYRDLIIFLNNEYDELVDEYNTNYDKAIEESKEVMLGDINNLKEEDQELAKAVITAGGLSAITKFAITNEINKRNARELIMQSKVELVKLVATKNINELINKGLPIKLTSKDGLQTIKGNLGNQVKEMAVKDLFNNTMDNYIAIANQVGVEVLIVSSVGDPCKFCKVWEGAELATAEGLGLPTVKFALSCGLGHHNCRHSFTIKSGNNKGKKINVESQAIINNQLNFNNTKKQLFDKAVAQGFDKDLLLTNKKELTKYIMERL